MKYFLSVLSLFFFLSTGLFAQVTNLTVNGSSTNFTMASGDVINWSYDIPDGGTADIQIWIDADQNNLLDENIDVLWQAFTQTDGSEGNNGPPDIDGSVNGAISFSMAIGLAPAHYIMSFKNNNVGQTVIGIITPLASPTFTIFGSITPAQANVAFNLESNSNNGTFWVALSDASGNFQIDMGADTSGNPWTLKIDNSYLFGSAIVSPHSYEITIDPGVATTYPGKDFTVSASAADIVGVLKDENGDPIIDGSDVWAWADNGNFNRYTRTDYTGTYKMGFSASELPMANLTLGSGDQWDTSFVSSQYTLSQINSGDHLTHDLYRFKTNSTIEGKVTLDNNVPNFEINLFASNPDTGGVQTLSNMNGDFIFHVSNKIYNYNINLNYMPQGYYYNTVVAHPGDKNVIINLTTTDVQEEELSAPTEYSMSQNYPNPFNPSTIIVYTVPTTGLVTLKVLDILGKEVATLVNEVKATGKYNMEFDGSNLSSGVYFYKLQSGTFSQTKKMILLK